MAVEAPRWIQPIEIFLGFLSIVVATAIYLSVAQQSMRALVSLLSLSLVFYAIRSLLDVRVLKSSSYLRAIGVAGGFVVGAIALVNVFDFQLRFVTLVPLFASGFIVYGVTRLANVLSLNRPQPMRVMGFGVVSITIILGGIALALPDLARITIVGVLGFAIVINGLESIISGTNPSSPKQIALIKLIAFAVFYGLLIVNWIDLFGSNAPGYHIWLILVYLAPFDVLLVFQGLKDWELAVCLALIVSLVNDLTYYVTGDLFFGFHVNLAPWFAGQLGFLGSKVLFTFDAGFFTVPVTSLFMGASVAVRVAIVAIVLRQWWKAPWRLRA